jgi:ATP-dependent Clp protease ATP-binding subunit ClpA
MPHTPDLFLPNGWLDRGRFTPAAAEALTEAVGAARATRWDQVKASHLVMGLLVAPDRTVSLWGLRAGLDLSQLLCRFRDLLRLRGTPPVAPRLHREFLSTPAILALRTARERADEHDRARISPADLLWALLAQDSWVTTAITDGGLPAPVLRVLLAEADRLHSHPSGASHPH